MGFGDTFSKFKTLALQKVGKAKSREEPEEFTAMIASIASTRKELQAILEVSKKLHERQIKIASSYEATAGAFTHANSSTSRGALIAAVPMINKVAEAQKALADNFRVTVIVGIEALLAVQVKAAEDAKKKLEDARLDFDAKEASFQSIVENKKATPSEIDTAKNKTDEAENAYISAKSNLESVCAQLEEAKGEFYRDNISQFADSLKQMAASTNTAAEAYARETN